MATVTVRIAGKNHNGFAVYASRFNGMCANCGQSFRTGTQIAYRKDAALADTLGLRSPSITVHYPANCAAAPPRECPTFTPSNQQRDIGDTLLKDKRHLLVAARAGTGKTTTMALVLFWLLAAVKAMLGKVAMLVFGAKNAQEMGTKVPPGVQASTLHAFGRAALLARYPESVLAAGTKPLGRFQKFQRSKTAQLLDCFIPLDTPQKHPLRKAAKVVPLLVSMAKKYAYLPNQQTEVDALIDHDIRPLDLQGADRVLVVELALKVLEAGLPHNGELPLHDFDDMVYIPAVDDTCVVTGKPLVIVDECQDMGPCDLRLVEKMLANGCRIAAVGDSKQAIMGFRGSEHGIVEKLRALLEANGGVVERPLTINRRCGKVHIRNVWWHIPDIQFDPEAPEGTLEAATLGQLYGQAKAGHAVLVRTNALGLAIVRRLRALRIPAVMKGKTEECEALLRRLDGITDGRNLPQVAFLEALEAYYAEQYTALSAAEKPSKWKLNSLAEDCDTLRGVALSTDEHGNEVTDCRMLKALIESLYDDNAPPEKCVTCSTIHRAKGLEWPVVWYLPLKTPHPCAASAAALEQEYNLIGVRDTRVRAKKGEQGSGRLIRVDGDPTAEGADKIGPDYTPPIPVPPASEAPAPTAEEGAE